MKELEQNFQLPQTIKTRPRRAARSRSTLSSVFALAVAVAATWGQAAFAPSAQAQAPDNTAQNAPVIETLRVTRGDKITIPLSNVTRIVPADEEVARGRFEDGQAVLEGVAPGTTLIAVQQGSGANAILRQYELEVLDGPVPAGTTPVPVLATPVPAETPAATPAIVPDATEATAPKLTASLNVAPAEDNPSQALFTITYGNAGGTATSGVVLRYALDDMVSYVTNSATDGGVYDAAKRELSWKIGDMAANETGKTVSFRVAPLEPSVEKFFSAATIENSAGMLSASNTIEYTFGPTPLLTVFALPDRIIQGRTAPTLVDVKGLEYQDAINRLQTMGVIEGERPGIYAPNAKTQRDEYTVMILRGLNLRDLRDAAAIRFVLSRRSTVNLEVRNSDGRVVSTLIRSTSFDAGEHTAVWDGKTPTGFAAPGRYAYVCKARDAKGMTTELRGYIHVIPQTPLQPAGTPSFTDISPTAWHAGYIALAEKQGLVQGYPNKEFRPLLPINREEATAVVVRAIGLEDLAKRVGKKDSGFLDDHLISNWAKGYVYVASSVAKTSSGKLIVGYPSNFYMPKNLLRRDEAAMVVQRLVDKETNRKLYVSGQMVPGASVTINQHAVQAADDGSFSFVLEQNNADPMSVAVIDRRR
jgi:Fe2+ transport system protein FeoA